MDREPRAILATSASRFGSSLDLIPAVRLLRHRYSNSLIAVAACSGTCEIITTTGLINRTIDLGVIKPSRHGPAKALQVLIKLMSGARGDNFDLQIDFSPQIETRIAAALSRGARRLSTARLPGILEFILRLSGDSRQDGGYAGVLRKLGIDGREMRFGLSIDEKESNRFERMLVKRGFSGSETLVVMFAGDAVVPVKTGWPVESFGELARRLDNNFRARTVAIDVPRDRSFTDAISHFLPKTGLTIPAPGGPALVAVLARASLVVTDDEGVARLSAEIGVPTLEVRQGSPLTDHRDDLHRKITGNLDETYAAACELLQTSRTSLLFGRQ